jgi:hypothetical protein
MGKGRIFQQVRKLSTQDQLTFNRWLKGNAIAAFLLATGLAVMVLAGPNSSREPALAAGKATSDIVAEASK